MKISADKNHPDYHEVVNFIDKVTVNGTILIYCVSIDIDAGEAVCITQPHKVKDGQLDTHVVNGRIDIIWRSMNQSQNGLVGSASQNLFLSLKRDWEEREDGQRLE